MINIIKIAGGVFLLIVLIILISSNSTKTVTCTQKKEILGVKTSIKSKAKFKHDKMRSLKYEMIEDYSGDKDIKKEDIEKEAKQYQTRYENRYDNLEIETKGKKLIVRYSAKGDSLSAASKDSYKSTQENLGFTCK